MRKLITIALASFLLANTAFAATCAEKAIDKHGKPLKGAAKTAFIKKCEKNTPAAAASAAPAPAAAPAASSCEAKAVSKKGKPLKGAAKKAFMKKCEAAAK